MMYPFPSMIPLSDNCYVLLRSFLVVCLSKYVPLHHTSYKDNSIILQNVLGFSYIILYSSVFPCKPDNNTFQVGQNFVL